MKQKFWIALFLVGIGFSFLTAQEENVENKIKEISARIEKTEVDKIWKISREMEKLGEESLPYLEKMSAQTGSKGKLVFAKILLENQRNSVGIELARKLVFSKDLDLTIRLSALSLIDKFAQKEDAVEGMKGLLEDASESPLLKIQVAKAVRKIGMDTKGSRLLKSYLKSSDPEIQVAAAFALAEVGNSSAQVKDILGRLSGEPTAEGIRARLLLEQIKLMDSLSQTQGLSSKMQVKALETKIEDLKRENKALQMKLEMGVNTGKALLDEIIDKVERYYDYRDPKEIDKNAMVEAAARGITKSLDPHSVYFNVEETKAFEESMASQYPGIGAYVQKASNGYLQVSQPIYSGPAYKAGLRSGDLIVEIFMDNKWTKTTQLQVPELVNKLRGPSGSMVKLKAWRKAWKEPKEFDIARQFVKVPQVYISILPGNMGYLQLTSFGEKCEEEFLNGLNQLESQGIKGLIVDLRNNPGGYLQSAVKIADYFLKGGKLIVYSQGRNTFKAPRKDHFSTDEGTHPDYPLIVLVNENSASASEILSGALKIHKRAILVGKKTYGKGSVQELMPLRSTNNKAILKLTIAKYYLPDGTNIDHKGIEVDVTANPIQGSVSVDEYANLLKEEAFQNYLDQNYTTHQKLFSELGQFDYFDETKYPQFEELYKSLKTNLSKKVVREVLRYKIRQKLSDEAGHILVGDFEEDGQLQVAIWEMLKKLGTEISSIPEYKALHKEPGKSEQGKGELIKKK